MFQINRGMSFGGERPNGKLSGSMKETRANNEALSIIIMLTIAHFIVYTPYPIIWSVRAAFKGSLSMDSNDLLTGKLMI